jgi:trehalose/maltose hydrolase-like predicted phosphorylase
MHRRGLLAAVVLGTAGAGAQTAAAADFVLATGRLDGRGFAPAFTGNGYLAGRQPAEGQGYAKVPLAGSEEPLPTQSQVQGFYAKASEPDTGPIERRAALPAWSTLRYDDGSGAYALRRGRVRGYRQRLDLRSGTLSTRVTWTSPGGRTALLRYDVTPDRARKHAALVRLRITPRFSGLVTVRDALNGRAAELTRAAGRGHAGRTQWTVVRSTGLGMRAAVASVLRSASGFSARALRPRDARSAAQRLTLRVRRGRTSTVTKAVGVAVAGRGGPSPARAAIRAARVEARLGYRAARRSSDAAWTRAWSGAVGIGGDAALRRQVHAAQFALLASLRDDEPWAPSPGGLSSDGYNGHVFWDSETWMYPPLLATAPRIARQLLRYRIDRLAAARANARRTGYRGARFPWESALTGSEETPSCCNTGKWEVHVNADIALAFWQHWLATGDRSWLTREAWPVVAGIADFWVSRAHRNGDGSWSIDGVIPPDEYHERVDDSVYTNVSTRDALRIATQVAQLTGHRARPAWATVAQRLRVPFDAAAGIHPEFRGYRGATVKQADVTLLSYPWENDQPASVTQADLDHYVPRTDPNGPSMTDAIHSIVTSQLGTPGCSAYTFTKRSADPFMRGPFSQFSESRVGGAFTFTTGAGGLLQEFVFGYTGMRWRADRVHLDPSLPPQLSSVTLPSIHWRGRVLRIELRRAATRVTLRSGAPLTLEWPAGSAALARGASATLPTRRPDEAPTADLARCRPATAAPATAEPAQAAVDGTDATSWLAERRGTRLTVDLGRPVALGEITLTRPAILAIARGRLGDRAVTGRTRSAGERVEASPDGRSWTLLSRRGAPPLRDSVDGRGLSARYVRVTALANASRRRPLVIGGLAVTAR